MTASIKLDARLVLATFIALAIGFVFFPGRASATLAGENGPIVYVEKEEVPTECENHVGMNAVEMPELCEEDVTQVVTTDNEGQNPVVAAEFSEEDGEEATTATISPNDKEGNHEIIFGTQKFECVEMDDMKPVDVSAVSVDNGYCYFYNASAVIYRVQIDADGNPLGEPEVITTVTGDEKTHLVANYYIELSYAPDGKTVVGTRFFFAESYLKGLDECFDECENEYGPKTTIERINLESGDLETLVDPVFDPFMNAGYAQDGTVYFTKTTFPEKPASPEFTDQQESQRRPEGPRPNSDVWYFAPGSTQAVQLTDTPDINEYFLSASPDSARLLVCDPTAREATYYLVNTKTGELTIVQLEEGRFGFLPLFFSPNGEGYLGMEASMRMYRKLCGERYEAFRTLSLAVEESKKKKDPAVAYAALLDFENAVVYNDLRNPDDWAPIVAFAEEEKPEVLSSVTSVTPKLQSTGNTSAIWNLVVGFFIVTTTTLTVFTRRQNI